MKRAIIKISSVFFSCIFLAMFASSCRSPDSIDIFISIGMQDFTTHYNQLIEEVNGANCPSNAQEGRKLAELLEESEAVGYLNAISEGNLLRHMETTAERKLSLQCRKIIRSLDMIALYAKNYDSLSDDQKQELEELYTFVFEQKDSSKEKTTEWETEEVANLFG